MYWLTENSFHPMMIGLLTAFVSGAFWFMLKKRMLFVVAILALIGTIGVVAIEQAIVTDKEQLVIEVNQVANAVSDNDMQAVLDCVSPKNDQMVAEVKRRMPRTRFRSVSVFNLSEPEVDYDASPVRAKLSFTSRVSADDSAAGLGGSGIVRVNLDYIKSDSGRWKIIGYNYDRVKPNDFFGGD